MDPPTVDASPAFPTVQHGVLETFYKPRFESEGEFDNFKSAISRIFPGVTSNTDENSEEGNPPIDPRSFSKWGKPRLAINQVIPTPKKQANLRPSIIPTLDPPSKKARPKYQPVRPLRPLRPYYGPAYVPNPHNTAPNRGPSITPQGIVSTQDTAPIARTINPSPVGHYQPAGEDQLTPPIYLSPYLPLPQNPSTPRTSLSFGLQTADSRIPRARLPPSRRPVATLAKRPATSPPVGYQPTTKRPRQRKSPVLPLSGGNTPVEESSTVGEVKDLLLIQQPATNRPSANTPRKRQSSTLSIRSRGKAAPSVSSSSAAAPEDPFLTKQPAEKKTAEEGTAANRSRKRQPSKLADSSLLKGFPPAEALNSLPIAKPRGIPSVETSNSLPVTKQSAEDPSGGKSVATGEKVIIKRQKSAPEGPANLSTTQNSKVKRQSSVNIPTPHPTAAVVGGRTRSSKPKTPSEPAKKLNSSASAKLQNVLRTFVKKGTSSASGLTPEMQPRPSPPPPASASASAPMSTAKTKAKKTPAKGTKGSKGQNKRTSTPNGRASKRNKNDVFDDPDSLMEDPNSIIYAPETNLKTILTSPLATTTLHTSDPTLATQLATASSSELASAIALFKEDGRSGRHDEEWTRQATAASERRKNGEFEEYEEARFREDWGDDDGEEEYPDDEEPAAKDTSNGDTPPAAATTPTSMETLSIEEPAPVLEG